MSAFTCGVLGGLALAAWCFFSVQAVVHEVPAYFPHCRRYDPNLSECLLKATEAMRPFLVQGIPDINMLSIDPLTITEVSLAQSTSTLNIKSTLKNIEVKGLSNYKFSKFEFDVPKLQFHCQLTVSPLSLAGTFNGSGSYLNSGEIASDGRFTANIDHSDITVDQQAKIVKRRGKDFLKTIQTNTTLEVKNPKVHVEGLLGGDKSINRAVNDLITDNIDTLFKDLKPVIEKVINSIIEDFLFKTIEKNIPFDNLYVPTT